ncbi:MAG: 23S rRNA (pseudouridine(1915)-N(3))-methyltransferase RlmH [Alphaproteobacteria bacterium]
MKIHVIAAGRMRGRPEAALWEDYAGRIRTWPLALHEVVPRRQPAPGQASAVETAALLAALPAGATVVALDEHGDSLDSRSFAVRLARWQEQQVADLAFLIGGADGLALPARGRAALLLSFGRATWPHLLVRALLAEQIYRAQQILAGHPYHRD